MQDDILSSTQDVRGRTRYHTCGAFVDIMSRGLSLPSEREGHDERIAQFERARR